MVFYDVAVLPSVSDHQSHMQAIQLERRNNLPSRKGNDQGRGCVASRRSLGASSFFIPSLTRFNSNQSNFFQVRCRSWSPSVSGYSCYSFADLFVFCYVRKCYRWFILVFFSLFYDWCSGIILPSYCYKQEILIDLGKFEQVSHLSYAFMAGQVAVLLALGPLLLWNLLFLLIQFRLVIFFSVNFYGFNLI